MTEENNKVETVDIILKVAIAKEDLKEHCMRLEEETTSKFKKMYKEGGDPLNMDIIADEMHMESARKPIDINYSKLEETLDPVYFKVWDGINNIIQDMIHDEDKGELAIPDDKDGQYKEFVADYKVVMARLRAAVKHAQSLTTQPATVRQALITLLEIDKQEALKANIPLTEIEAFDANVRRVIQEEGLPKDEE